MKLKFSKKSLSLVIFPAIFLAFFAFLASLLLSIIPLGSNYRNVSAQPPANLIVSAAISLQPALEAITAKYSDSNLNITYNFGGSGGLQQQIEQGAPVDVFVSAAIKQMDALENKGFLSFRANLLTNRLALIVPKENIPPKIKSEKLSNFRQLLNPDIKRIAIAEPRSVPAGQYSKEVLQNLGILTQLQPKFVLGNNVRFVLTAVETGEVDAGIVYITDAKNSPKVEIVAVAEQKFHAPIIYPIGIIKSSKNPQAAQKYVRFLQSFSAQKIFRSYGFGIAANKILN